MKASVRACDPV